jgi:hypothetical protein
MTCPNYSWTEVAMLAAGMSPLLLFTALFFAALVRVQWTE